jgi:hypothetical protein
MAGALLVLHRNLLRRSNPPCAAVRHDPWTVPGAEIAVYRPPQELQVHSNRGAKAAGFDLFDASAVSFRTQANIAALTFPEFGKETAAVTRESTVSGA